MRRSRLVVLFACGACACGARTELATAADAGVVRADASSPPDTGVPRVDASGPDAGLRDAGLRDAGLRDADSTPHSARPGLLDAADPVCFDDVAPPFSADVPSDVSFAPWDPASGLLVDLGQCEPCRWSVFLPFGSAWVVSRADGDHCEVWLGGETEDPRYEGAATQFCRFRREACGARILVGAGGPARIESPACTP